MRPASVTAGLKPLVNPGSSADLVGPEGIDADGEIRPGATSSEFSQQSYGAHFAEVGVDIDTGEVRLRRMLGVFTAGRILNEKTAAFEEKAKGD